MSPRSNNTETEQALRQGKVIDSHIDDDSSSSDIVDDLRTDAEKEADRKVCLYLPILVTLDMFAVSLVVVSTCVFPNECDIIVS